MTNTIYRIDTARVVSEVIDGEAIIMDLGSGAYFSADGLGAEIWAHIEAGASRGQIIAWVTTSFPDSPAQADTETFIDSLIENGLVEAASAARVAPLALQDSAAAAWLAPVLQVHKDMQDLIMLDPIHDVSSAGWPMKKSDMVD